MRKISHAFRGVKNRDNRSSADPTAPTSSAEFPVARPTNNTTSSSNDSASACAPYETNHASVSQEPHENSSQVTPPVLSTLAAIQPAGVQSNLPTIVLNSPSEQNRIQDSGDPSSHLQTNASIGPIEPAAHILSTSPSRGQNKAKVWRKLGKLLGNMSRLVGNTLGPLQLPADSINRCIEVFEAVSKNREGHGTLQNELETLLDQLESYFGNDTPPSITPSIVSIVKAIEHEVEFVARKQEQTGMSRFLDATREANEMAESRDRVQMLLKRLELNANVGVWRTVNEMLTDNHLRSLPIAPEAKHRSAESAGLRRVGCATNTRKQVLEDLSSWVNARSRERIYWLNGMAGTGKTTIAYSLCENMRTQEKLAGSFFCSRQLPSCRNVNRIVPTISYQLALFSRPFRHALSFALSDLDIHNQLLSDQFECLVASPLRAIQHAFPVDTVVVIDALDECEDNEGVANILDVLLRSHGLPIKFFVSSRPDVKILECMRNRSSGLIPAELRLHNLDQSIVRQDIELYLSGALRPHMSISRSDVETIAARSGGLFIYAATVVRYIRSGGAGRSPRRLGELLSAYRAGVPSTNNEREMDELYTTILQLAFSNPGLYDVDREEIRFILYTIICAQEPLSVHVIAGLLGVDSEMSILSALSSLLPVLNISDATGVVNALHLSFYDFILDQHRSGPFYCDKNEQHTRMMRLCFDQIARVNPPFNICALESSYKLDHEVLELAHRVDTAISKQLFYACRYWGEHLNLATDSKENAVLLFEFLSKRLLLWMEVLNLKGCIRDGIGVLYEIREWSKTKEEISQQTRDLVQDSYEFVSAFSSSQARFSTPHIYISHLSFWPDDKPIKSHYQPQESRLIMEGSTAKIIRSTAPITIFDTQYPVICLAHSPSEAKIASGSGDGPVRIWDAHTGKQASAPLLGHTDCVNSVAYSPDGAYIVSGSTDKTICIWNAHAAQTVGQPLKGHTDAVNSVAYSPDGSYVVSGSSDETVRVWDTHTGHAVGEPLRGHCWSIYSVAYSPDGAYIISACGNSTVLIWDAHTRTQAWLPLNGHCDRVKSVAYSPNSAYFISGSDDTNIRIWYSYADDSAGEIMKGHTKAVESVACSPDGAFIASGSRDKTIRIWDVSTGRQVGEPLEGHTDAVNSIAYTPDGAYIVSGSWDHTIRIWDVRANRLSQKPKSHTGNIKSAAYSPDGAYIVSGSSDKNVRIWDAHTGKAVGSPLEGHAQWVTSVTYSPDGSRIVSGSGDHTIRIWDAHTGKTVGRPLIGHREVINSVSCSPDGAHIASGSNDGTICIWDAHANLLMMERREAHTSWVKSVAYSPNGANIVSGSGDRTVRIWNAHTMMLVGQPLDGHTHTVYSVAYSPDSTRVVSGSRDQALRIWDAHAGKQVGRPLEGHNGSVNSVSYSPDGSYIVSCSDDKTIRVWDAHTGNIVIKPLEGHTSWVISVACSPDGMNIVSTSDDKTLRVWRVFPPSIDNQYQQEDYTIVTPNTSGVVRNLETRPPHTCNSNCQIIGRHHGWLLDNNGWLIAGSNRLVWIPVELRGSLVRPRDVTLICEDGSVLLEFHSNNVDKVGHNWCQHFRPALASV